MVKHNSTEKSWSPQQQAIFGWFEAGAGNLVVRARAGTGKTTTILEGVGRAPERRVLLCAFNKRIAKELEGRLRWPHVQAKTLHSLGYRIVGRHWERCGIDKGDKRLRQLAAEALPGNAPDAIVRLVARLATTTKEVAPFATDPEVVAEIAERFDIKPKEEHRARWSLVSLGASALNTMDACAAQKGPITFADMLWLPLKLSWASPAFDLVVVDEAQDMNPAQLELAQRVAAGRVAVVGDDRQAIYGFRGADSGSIDRLKAALDADELSLNVTYRCPQRVVREAMRYVPDFKAADGNADGVVTTIARRLLADRAEPGDFILSRKNAPLVKICLSLLRARKRARIEGKDIGRGLSALVRNLDASTMPELLCRLEDFRDAELRSLSKLKDQDLAADKAEQVNDRVDTIFALAEGLTYPAELLARIDELFADDVARASVIVCSSVHKAKGLEAGRVFILRDTLRVGAQNDNRSEEANIAYVAITRAQRELVWVEGAS